MGLELMGFAPDALRSRVARRVHRVETVSDEGELDARLSRAEEMFTRDDDAARAYLATFELAAPPMPDDPFSEPYLAAQWDLYRRIARRDRYELDAEHTDIDLSRCVQSPYPYSTGSASQVADQLAACTYIIRRLQPRPGQRVLEYGSGWGNLTMQLAMLSVDVTAVEVSGAFAELLRRRAAGYPNLTVVESDMLSYQPDRPFDAVIFYESFHHCADHLAMLRQLRSFVRPEGRVLFAGEPITAMPYPWGLRLDGLSLFGTRTFGWLELGFSNRYFAAALRRTGWSARRHRSRSLTPLADVITATPVAA